MSYSENLFMLHEEKEIYFIRNDLFLFLPDLFKFALAIYSIPSLLVIFNQRDDAVLRVTAHLSPIEG